MSRLRKLGVKIESELIPLGYRRAPDRVAYYLEEPGRRRIVDVEANAGVKKLRVYLNDWHQEGQRSIELSEFRGRGGYAYDGELAQSVENEVVEDLVRFGIPWLAGEEVSTLALVTREIEAQRFRFAQLVERGTSEFKEGHFAAALQLFEEAQKIGELGNAPSKMKAIATRKAGVE